MHDSIENRIGNCKPMLNGERFLTDKDVSEQLKVSRRTLQEGAFQIVVFLLTWVRDKRGCLKSLSSRAWRGISWKNNTYYQGITGQACNDIIVKKTFETAPYQ